MTGSTRGAVHEAETRIWMANNYGTLIRPANAGFSEVLRQAGTFAETALRHTDDPLGFLARLAEFRSKLRRIDLNER